MGISKELEKKYNALKELLQGYHKFAVAYSGGVDSTFLLRAAQEVLGNDALAVTINAESVTAREFEETKLFCAERKIRQIVCNVRQMDIEGFVNNPPNRCYFCKLEMFRRLQECVTKEGINVIVEGSNVDDIGDYRPGMQALLELGIKSPLKEAGLTKKEIRELSKWLGLSTWDKPSCACLASRFAYGERITEERLRHVERAEQYLLDLGFESMRVRVHQNIARIEIPENQIEHIVKPELREQIVSCFKECGFTYVSLDLQGFRSGSMNEDIGKGESGYE